MAAQVRAILPVFCGISGSCRTIFIFIILFETSRNELYILYYYTTKAPKAYTEIEEYPESVYIMFGKESKGLPEELLRDNREHCVRIPMRSTLRSLNLSNSVAIAVYEILRHDNFDGLCETGELTKYSW